MNGVEEVSFQDRLRFARTAQGLTQTGVAKKIEMSLSSYQKIEQGILRPGEKALKKLSIVLQVSVTALVGNSLNPVPTPTPISPEPDPPEDPKEIPTAANGDRHLYKMSDGFLCTAKSCEWRTRVDEKTFYCPGCGCLKKKREEKANAKKKRPAP